MLRTPSGWRDLNPRPLVPAVKCRLFVGVRSCSEIALNSGTSNISEHRRTSADSVQVGEHQGEHPGRGTLVRRYSPPLKQNVFLNSTDMHPALMCRRNSRCVYKISCQKDRRPLVVRISSRAVTLFLMTQLKGCAFRRPGSRQ